MTLSQVYLEIVRRPLRQRNDPFLVSPDDWIRLRDEVEAYQKSRGEPVWSEPSGFLNFKVAGVEVRIAGTEAAA